MAINGRIDTMTDTSSKPTLMLMQGSAVMDLEAVLRFYKALTGRDPTPEQVEAARQRLNASRKPGQGWEEH